MEATVGGLITNNTKGLSMSMYFIVRMAAFIVCIWFLAADIVGAMRYSLTILLLQSFGYLLIAIVMMFEIFYDTNIITSVLMFVGLIWIIVFGRIVHDKMEYHKISWLRLLLFRKQ